MHRIISYAPPFVGMVWAGVSWVVVNIAQVASEIAPISRGWIELGGTLGLIGGLSYGTITLWRELQAQKAESREERNAYHSAIENLNLEIRTEKREQNDRLIAVLEKLDRKS